MCFRIVFFVYIIFFFSSEVSSTDDWTTYNKNIVDTITALEFEDDVIWLGTPNGLAMFNKVSGESKSFTKFDGLVDNRINGIAIDHDRIKWIATDNGISSFDGIQWISYTNKDEIGHVPIVDVTIDSNNRKWFISNDTVSCFNGEKWQIFTDENGLPAVSLTKVAVDSTDTIWIGTNQKGIISFSNNKWTLHEEFKPWVVSIAVDNQNNIWFGNRKGTIISYDGEKWLDIFVVSSFYYIFSVAVSSDSIVWVGTNAGLYKIENDNTTVFTDKNGLENSLCREIKIDQNGNFWISGYSGLTEFNGLKFINHLGFTGSGYSSVYSIAIDYENVKWFGHLTDTISYYDNTKWSYIKKTGYTIGEGIYVDKFNVKWFTACGDGALSYDGILLKEWTIRTPDSETHPHGYAVCTRCIEADSNNYIYFGTTSEESWEYPAYIFRYDGNSITRYSNIEPISMTIDSFDNIWSIDNNKIIMFNGKEKIYYSYRPDKKIYADNDDVIWCTSSSGLYRYDGISWFKYTVSNSDIASEYTIAIAEDKNNIKWIGTDAGVCRFDGETWTTFNTQNSGLCDNKVNTIAVEKNNTIWFGTDNGVSRYTGEMITTSVNESKPKPETLLVIRSYPNPFNPSTTIEFNLPEAGSTTLVIYNIAGQKVRGLVSESLAAGHHTAVWDSKDDSGSSVSAGIYFARLTCGGMTTTGKMVMVR